MTATRRRRLPYFLALLLFTHTSAFSLNNGNNNEDRNNLAKDIMEPINQEVSDSFISRRNLLFWPIGIGGAVVYGKLVKITLDNLLRGELAFPEDHEKRVRMVLSKSLVASAQSLLLANKNPNDNLSLAEGPQRLSRPFRVLEVGVGNEWRLARRGLYREALQDLSQMGSIRDLEVTGVDLVSPKDAVLQQARDRMQSPVRTEQDESSPGLNVNLIAKKGSITSKLDDYPNGYFDAVICSLTLCSVDDQAAALKEIHRLVRSSGGTFGYLEHVAVSDDEPYVFLELSQKVFDPVQQALVDNCHLHRYTDESIAEEFQLPQDNGSVMSASSSYLLHERFLVDGMWPISCQCCGVIQQGA